MNYDYFLMYFRIITLCAMFLWRVTVFVMDMAQNVQRTRLMDIENVPAAIMRVDQCVVNVVLHSTNTPGDQVVKLHMK